MKYTYTLRYNNQEAEVWRQWCEMTLALTYILCPNLLLQVIVDFGDKTLLSR